jgi:hypothetical protein
MTQSIRRGFTLPKNEERNQLLEFIFHAREYLFASRGSVDRGCAVEDHVRGVQKIPETATEKVEGMIKTATKAEMVSYDLFLSSLEETKEQVKPLMAQLKEDYA